MLNGHRIMGLDIETTGSDFTDRIRTIQIGVVDSETGAMFTSDIKWERSDFDFVEEAREVNGFTDERIAEAPLSSEVDMQLACWLSELGVVKGRAVVVGFNVGGFDMPFVRRDLPVSALKFSYQTLDLNAVIFAYALSHDIPWKNVKDYVVRSAKLMMPSYDDPRYHQHDARYDAKLAILCLQVLLEGLRNPLLGGSH
jgi:DNA polymerase III epsilon subunit-like protein